MPAGPTTRRPTGPSAEGARPDRLAGLCLQTPGPRLQGLAANAAAQGASQGDSLDLEGGVGWLTECV